MNRSLKSNFLAGLLLFSGSVVAQTLHQNVLEDPIIDEAGGNCVWHFVHNQLDSDQRDLVTLPELTVSFDTDSEGMITATASPNKVNKKVIHYMVTTDPAGSISLKSAQDTLDGQNYLGSNGKDKLLYSHHTCDGTPPAEPVACPCEEYWNLGSFPGAEVTPLKDRNDLSAGVFKLSESTYCQTSDSYEINGFYGDFGADGYGFIYSANSNLTACVIYDAGLATQIIRNTLTLTNEQESSCRQLLQRAGCQLIEQW